MAHHQVTLLHIMQISFMFNETDASTKIKVKESITTVSNGQLAMYAIMEPEIPIQLIYVKNIGNSTPNPFAIEYIYIEYSEDNSCYFVWIVLKKIYSGKVTSKILYI